MRTTCKILLAAFCCTFAGGYYAFGAEDVIAKTMKVSVSSALPPQAKTTGTVGANSSNSKNNWVQVDIRFHTDDVKSTARRFLADPQLSVELAVYPQNNKDRCVVFSGNVNYWFVEQDGNDHNMRMLLPAVFCRRFCGDRSIDRITFVAKAVLSFGGKRRAVEYGSNKGLSSKEISSFFRALPRNAIVVPGTMSGRSGTPWSMIEVNKFEFEKQPWLQDARIEPVTKSGRPATPVADPAGTEKKKKKKR